MVTNLTEYVELQARINPNKIAISDENSFYSFRDVYELALGTADKINKLKLQSRKPVVIICEKCTFEIITFFGVLFSGDFYVPLDIHMPNERMEKIVKRLECEIFIADDKGAEKLESIGIVDNIIKFSCISKSTNRNELSYSDTDPAYILFTSGTTGEPKGVVVSHRAVIDYVEWQCGQFDISEKDVLANQAPFYFDASIPDIFTPFYTGATLQIIPEHLFLLPDKLINYLNMKNVSVMIWVPSSLIVLAKDELIGQKRINNVRLVMFCGEVMPCKYLNIWMKYYEKTKFVNLYGPTEAAYACTYYEIDRKFDDDDKLPIGKPCKNTKILLITDDNRIAQVGEEGEICIGGSCLFSGYYNMKDRTELVLKQNPLNNSYVENIYFTGDIAKYNSNGELEYIGRKDHQIKFQGYRIELGEIEAAADSIEEVYRSCAVYDGEKIVLFCSLSKNISEREIYNILKQKINRYMLPRVINIMDELPLNVNGKIDRTYLKKKILSER